MQKIYVLLRHDKQTGPYSLQEIIQFDLKPYDLIWIEGKSAGWYYPQEIAALHPYLSFLPKSVRPAVVNENENKSVFVSMPSTVKIETLQTVDPEPAPIIPAEAFTANRPSSNNIEEKVYAQFRKAPEEKEPVDITPKATTEQKSKSSRSAVVAITTVLVVGGVFAASWMMNRQPNQENTVFEVAAETPVQADSANSTAIKDNPAQTTPLAARKQRPAQSGSGRTSFPLNNQQHNSPGQKKKPENTFPADESNQQGTDASPNVEEEEQVVKTNPTTPAETPAPQEKKKTVRDKFLDLFRKKPEEQKEERRPTETANGERVATRREGSANLSQMVHLRFDIPNDWMMGIRGAKATLVNRSNEKISKATVEVLYFDEDNNLLQKKTITFSKVDGKESKTITIPDHPSATKVDYEIASVTGEPAA